MKIATQHSEAIGKRPRIGVKEGLLLDRVALHAAYVSPRHVQCPGLVVADFTHPRLALWNRTAVSAGVTTHAPAVNLLVEVSLADVLIQDVTKGTSHGNLYYYFRPRWRKGQEKALNQDAK